MPTASTTRRTRKTSTPTRPLPRRPSSRRWPSPQLVLPVATLAAAALLVAESVQTVWWTPLNVDEELTLRVADFSFGHVFHIVSTQRGGGPLHFWLEHFLQQWRPGLESLRVPSLVFACLALPAVALIVRELIGDTDASGVVLLT